MNSKTIVAHVLCAIIIHLPRTAIGSEHGSDEGLNCTGVESTCGTLSEQVDVDECAQGTIFDRQSSRCISDCNEGYQYVPQLQSCVSLADVPNHSTERTASQSRRKSPRRQCKNITVTPDLLRIVREMPTADRIYYEHVIDSAESKSVHPNYTICFKYSNHFRTCKLWLFREDEYEFRDGAYRIWIPTHKTLYDIGDFLIRGDKEAVVCVPEHALNANESRSPIIEGLYGISWIISIVSLSAAFILCIYVPNLRHYCPVLPFHIVSLLVAYSVLVARAYGSVPNSDKCFAFGVVQQFSFLAAFFWLNILSFDIWRGVSSSLSFGKIGDSANRSGFPGRTTPARLYAYLAYGWGSPLLIVGASVALDKVKSLHDQVPFRPHFEDDCWIRGRYAMLVLFYGPIALILAVNAIFFVLTVINVRALSKMVASSDCHSNNKQTLRTSAELAVVMGLCWMMEIISWAVGGNPTYWYFTDILNALQGFLILIVLVNKPGTLSYLTGKWRCCKRRRLSIDTQASYIADAAKGPFDHPRIPRGTLAV